MKIRQLSLRLRRLVFIAAHVASVVLCLASATMWLRSYRWVDAWHVAFGRTWVDFDTSAGGFGLLITVCHDPEDAAWPTTQIHRLRTRQDRITEYWRIRRFSFGFLPQEDVPSYYSINAPLWAVMLISLCPPALTLAVRWRTRSRMRYRMRQHLCLRCGYDLRATPDRCPECGTLVPARQNNKRDGLAEPHS
jgi:hypothetical protein